MRSLTHSNPSSLTRSVSFSDVLAFQSPPAFHKSRRLSTSASDHKRSRPSRTTARTLFSSSTSSGPSDDRSLSRRSNQTHLSTSRDHRHKNRHRSKHHRHHRHHPHRHHQSLSNASDKENAFVIHAGNTPAKRADNFAPLRERVRNLSCIDDDVTSQKKKNRHCSRSHCRRRHNKDLTVQELASHVPDMPDARREYIDQLYNAPAFVPVSNPYNITAQEKYTSQLQPTYAHPVPFDEQAPSQPSFYPSLDPVPEPNPPSHVAQSEEPSALDRIAFIEQNGAKAHLHRFVFFHLQLPADEGWEDMLHGLDGAQLHALYRLSREEACGLALLRRAEAEEREVARLHVEARKGLGKYAVARIIADERRVMRVALLSLRRFLENEGGIWIEEHGVQRAVIAMGRRIERLREAPDEIEYGEEL